LIIWIHINIGSRDIEDLNTQIGNYC